MEVSIVEVGPRDGLQNEPSVLDVSARIALCDRLSAAGLRRIEAVSFVDPRVVPQMANAEDVVRGLQRTAGVSIGALVLNGRGLERALEAEVDELHLSYAVTDAFCRRNQNARLDEAAAAASAMLVRAQAARVRASVTLSVAFGCPFSGRVDPAAVVEHAGRAAEAGAAEIILADTIGVAVPTQVRALVRAVEAAVGDTPIGLHLHNTRNTGYANAVAGLDAGVELFDASIGGLGGCPFAPNATGNVATEDLVNLFEGMGVHCGVDLDALIEVAVWLEDQVGHELPGLVHRAGPFRP